MKPKLSTLLPIPLISVFCFLQPVNADEVESVHARQSLGVSINDFGLGIEYSRKLTNNYQVRFGIHGISSDESDLDISAIDYQGDFESSSITAALDWYPVQSGWGHNMFLSAGLIGFKTDFDGKAQNQFGKSLRVGNQNIAPTEGNELQLEFEHETQISPTLAIGWGNHIVNSGFSFTISAGIMHVDTPKVALTFTPTEDISEAIDEETQSIKYQLGGISGFGNIGVTYTF